MTRDQAIRKVIAPDAGYDFEHALVDTLAALGLLTLEEEKGEIEALCHHEDMPNPIFLKNRLACFGLKIVKV